MAIEDAVTLGEALRVNGNDFEKAFDRYQHSRVARTARIDDAMEWLYSWKVETCLDLNPAPA